MKKAFLLIVFIFTSVTLFAQTKSEEKSAFKLSFNERLRIETYDNLTDLNNKGTGNQTYTRTKSTLGLEWSISSDVSFTAKLTNEFRKYLAPKTNPFHYNEIFFEGLSLKVNNLLSGTLTIGRQDISLGDGFIIKEGTPNDGTRAYYFNAIRFDWKLDKTNTITLLGLYAPREDNLLPVFNGKDLDASAQGENSYILNEQTENGIGAYYSGDFGKFNFQGYYFLKSIFNYSVTKPGSTFSTIGARVKNPFSDDITLTAEAAYQFGTLGDVNRTAYAGSVYLDYKTNTTSAFIPKLVTPAIIALSGDDPTTTDYEGWDPVFARWPRWSVSYGSLLGKEYGKAAYWSNMIMFYLKLEFNVAKDVDFIVQNQYMVTPQKSAKTTLLSGDGTTRGNLSTFQLLYKFNGNMTGHFLWEHFEPGDYYFLGHDNYNFIRMEITFAIQ